LGFLVIVCFELAVNEKDKDPAEGLIVPSREDLLLAMREYFGVGNIYYNTSDNTCKFKVTSLEALRDVIIPHFQQCFLLTKKRIDFELFSRVVKIIAGGDHLSLYGLQEIVNIKASLNLGLSDKIKAYFPETVPVTKPVFDMTRIPDPQ